MTSLVPETLQELHRIRERIAQEQADLSPCERVERTRREAEALLKEWGLTLRERLPRCQLSSGR